MSDPLAPLLAALARESASSSDFDLNPGVVLPEGRKLRPAGVLMPVQVIDGVATKDGGATDRGKLSYIVQPFAGGGGADELRLLPVSVIGGIDIIEPGQLDFAHQREPEFPNVIGGFCFFQRDEEAAEFGRTDQFGRQNLSDIANFHDPHTKDGPQA